MKKAYKKKSKLNVATKRVYELVKGDVFIWYGSRYLVTSVSESTITYKAIGHFDGGGNYYTFGIKNQMRVEIPDIHKQPDTIQDWRHSIATYDNIKALK